MRSYLVRGLLGRAVPRSLVTVAAAALLAGCSGSIDRFNNKQAYDNPSDADPVYTASVPKQKKIKRPVYSEPDYSVASDEDQIIESPVKRAAVPQTNTYNYADAYTKPSYKKPKPRYVAPVEESYDDASYEQPAPAPVRRKKIYAEESYDTGSMEAVNGRVTVGPGMTLYSIARTNGVTVQDIADANNLVEPYMLMTGQTLRIPGSSENFVAAPRKKKLRQPVEEMDMASDEEPVAKPKKSRRGLNHTVEEGETLYSLGRKYGVSPFVIADANGMTAKEGLAIGQKIRIPGAKQQVAAAEPVDEEIAAPAPVKKKKAPLALPDDEESAQADADEEQAIGETETATAKKTVVEEEPEQQASAPAAVNGLTLRWPVKGKVISTFGNKPNGLKNEGINIAVPEGTEVRAAGAGVIAYAGNELKGYGNLVLIRHPGGYVTAYAHAKSLKVKRGDQVKRGDVIALAGQTGAVNSPQLHFEVRKGATALDPLKFITSATASN